MSTITASRANELDPGRIVAGAGAIALNGALLMLLLVPVAAPSLVTRPQADLPDVILIRPTPPVTPPPIDAEVRRQPQPIPQPTTVPAPPTPSPPQPNVDISLPVDAVVPAADPMPGADATEHGDAGPVDAGPPLQGAHLRYASAPPPPYPREALREGLSGTVMLQVLVDVDGRPLEVTLARSSGHRALDVAARRHVLAHWKFHPAMRGGQPVQAVGIVPVEFTLD